MTKTNAPQPGDLDYDPSKDPAFLDKVDPPKASTLPAPKIGAPEDKGGYAGTGLTADELVEKFGTNPDGSPRTEPAPDGPTCPPVSPDGYPFDEKAIPAGLSQPLSAECVAYYNKLYAPSPETMPTVNPKVGLKK